MASQELSQDAYQDKSINRRPLNDDARLRYGLEGIRLDDALKGEFKDLPDHAERAFPLVELNHKKSFRLQVSPLYRSSSLFVT